MEKVLVLMSGGVDSSTTAYILKRQGYYVEGVSFKLFDSKRHLKHLEDAKRVSESLGIKHTILDVSEDFKREIISYFLREYASGRTPNPCAFCNRLIKVKWGLALAREKGFDFIATGHYARILRGEEGVHLLKALWKEKSQEYYLALLDRESLSRLLFPLGELEKSDVRAIAREAGLFVSEKPESQEVCFIEGDYRDFLLEHGFKEKEGDIKDKEGKVIGKHRGYYFYTIGQRRGLKVARGKRLYVKGIDPEKNEVVLGEIDDLMGRDFWVRDYNFIEDVPERFECKVKVRYRGEEALGIVEKMGDRLRVSLHSPLFAITPGQIAVFYHGDMVLGGGVIDG